MKASTVLQIATIVVFVGALEVLCRTGIITGFTMIPPSQMAVGLYRGLASGKYIPSLKSTMMAAGIAAVAAIVSGCILGAALHASRRIRRTVEPLLSSYYAVPIWSFYPLFVYLFGLSDAPKIVIAYLYAVVAMIINTLNGLDRVPHVYRKTASALGMRPWQELVWITIPAALSYMVTGVKLAVSYAIIGVVGSEFILSTGGIGYDIAWGYTSFDNNLLYPMILLVIVIAVALNAGLSAWERTQVRRRVRA
jgi:NitT/TauT family transport system permease protein